MTSNLFSFLFFCNRIDQLAIKSFLITNYLIMDEIVP